MWYILCILLSWWMKKRVDSLLNPSKSRADKSRQYSLTKFNYLEVSLSRFQEILMQRFAKRNWFAAFTQICLLFHIKSIAKVPFQRLDGKWSFRLEVTEKPLLLIWTVCAVDNLEVIWTWKFRWRCAGDIRSLSNSSTSESPLPYNRRGIFKGPSWIPQYWFWTCTIDRDTLWVLCWCGTTKWTDWMHDTSIHARNFTRIQITIQSA